ncbi:response regulator [Noviherbaspirillum sp. ST9]|uniref:response regulator n=1 Tax=Noviherbaspirillum sp. ST9 TaxID=3401606 RepID=UPI003B58743A
MSKGHRKAVDILLVEDNPGDVRLTRECLLDNKVHNTLNVVVDGEEAMYYLRKEGKYANATTPDLIMLDLNLPRKSGFEVLKEIKADENLKVIPVVVLTSSEAEKDILASYSLHANAFVSKPVDLFEFTNAIAQIKGFWLEIVKFPLE